MQLTNYDTLKFNCMSNEKCKKAFKHFNVNVHSRRGMSKFEALLVKKGFLKCKINFI